MHPRADDAGQVFQRHDDHDDDQQDRRRGVVFVAVKGGVEGGSDAACADQAQDRAFAEVDVEAVHRQADEARHDLRLDAVVDPLRPACARGLDRLGLHFVHAFDVFGQQFRQKADGGKAERQEARKRAKAEDGDQKDGDDDLLQGAADRDDRAADQIDRQGATLRAAPSAIGIEIAMPTTEDATVMMMLSSMPSQISLEREVKSGMVKARTNCLPRSSPS